MSIALTSQFISCLKSKIRLNAKADKSGPNKNDSFIMLLVSPYLGNNHILIFQNLNSIVMLTHHHMYKTTMHSCKISFEGWIKDPVAQKPKNVY